MQKLFSEFNPSSAEEWKAQLLKDLKGEAFESLIWKNDNGFDVRPFYTGEDLKQDYEPAFTHADWEICVAAKAGDAKQANLWLLKQLNSGATAIALHGDQGDAETLLKHIQLNFIRSSFHISEKYVSGLRSHLEKNYALADLQCSLFPETFKNAKDLHNWLEVTSPFQNCKNIRTRSVDALAFHNQDCLAYYEVAIILSALNEYLNAANGNKINDAAFAVKTGVSSDYFVQIAKLRAIRRLWKVLSAEYNLNNELYLVVETGSTNKSISDSYNNLLRTTVEAMAAVSGGCNELLVTGFDTFFSVNASLSDRMAVNQQLILKEESFLDKMADTGCGSYYIESLTDAIAQKALDALKYFEKEGGYFACLEKNIFSNEIKQQAAKKAELINTQKQISIGVNKFRNEKEKIDLSAEKIAQLKNLEIVNPVLNFELEHYFKQHA